MAKKKLALAEAPASDPSNVVAFPETPVSGSPSAIVAAVLAACTGLDTVSCIDLTEEEMGLFRVDVLASTEPGADDIAAMWEAIEDARPVATRPILTINGEPIPRPGDVPAAGPAPVLDVVQRSLTELPEEDRAHLRGLFANGAEIRAMRRWRELVVERGLTDADPGLGAAKEAMESIATQAPAPEGFVVPSVEAEAEPTLEESVVFPGEPPAEPPRVEPPPTGRRVLKRGVEDVRVILTDEEKLERGQRLAQSEADITGEELTQAGIKKELKEKLTTMKHDRADLAGVLRDGFEVRSISVIHEADYDSGVIRVIEEDTGRVLSETPIASGTQVPLFGAGGGGGTERHSEDGDEWPAGDGSEDGDGAVGGRLSDDDGSDPAEEEDDGDEDGAVYSRSDDDGDDDRDGGE